MREHEDTEKIKLLMQLLWWFQDSKIWFRTTSVVSTQLAVTLLLRARQHLEHRNISAIVRPHGMPNN
jgi:hypothetical protein